MKASKGSAFEREFCKTLSRWWLADPDSKESLFWRTAGSGGRATTRAKSGLTTHGACGDIASTHESSMAFSKVFTLELKRGYNRATFHDLIDRPARARPVVYEQWIDQAAASAKAAKTHYWLLVHKRDAKDAVVVFPASLTVWHDRLLRPKPKCPPFLPGVFTRKDQKVRTEVCCTTLTHFLNRLKPEDVRGYAEAL